MQKNVFTVWVIDATHMLVVLLLLILTKGFLILCYSEIIAVMGLCMSSFLSFNFEHGKEKEGNCVHCWHNSYLYSFLVMSDCFKLGGIIICILDFYACMFYKLSFYCFTLVTNKLYFYWKMFLEWVYIYQLRVLIRL